MASCLCPCLCLEVKEPVPAVCEGEGLVIADRFGTQWSLRSTVDASYEYRIRQSVEDARTVDEMLEEESWGHWRALTEQQQEDAVRRARDQRRYVEMSDAAARMGTF